MIYKVVELSGGSGYSENGEVQKTSPKALLKGKGAFGDKIPSFLWFYKVLELLRRFGK